MTTARATGLWRAASVWAYAAQAAFRSGQAAVDLRRKAGTSHQNGVAS